MALRLNKSFFLNPSFHSTQVQRRYRGGRIIVHFVIRCGVGLEAGAAGIDAVGNIAQVNTKSVI